ncbi:helix-turn-helix domain-containing protein [Ruixingdingia sedimenti]|nr:helix-turn-helix domain-containing protein [Xinfangfangia sp. LG-4]MDR5655002.1 helix-turn-helix domain-containing protein [Xinfangfangia sp. LG-4]
MLRLQAHDWPGNLRELRNMIEALSATSFSRLVDVTDLPQGIAHGPGKMREDTLRDRERAEILNAVAQCGGNMTETARRLGISRSTLYLKLEQYGVPRGRRH